jgi:Rps23 Pro-64 3,4-dihydroxylase Tpa1-like proline 4-hydroxylase
MNYVIAPIDREAVRQQYQTASPFPFFVIEDFLDHQFIQELVTSYPDYETARQMGREFQAVNERLKVQVTDQKKFPPPVSRLADALSGSEFLSDLEFITGIPKLLADPHFGGGGMHLTGPTGRLDVHVDFNRIEEKGWFRRLNILIYLNPVWDSAWGGNIELWNKDVSKCHHSMSPTLNRCVVFETSDISYHGVTPIKCPPGFVRKSFAAYYYTREAPSNWDGQTHSTVFRARPDEKLRGAVMMPAEKFGHRVNAELDRGKRLIKRLLGR